MKSSAKGPASAPDDPPNAMIVKTAASQPLPITTEWFCQSDEKFFRGSRGWVELMGDVLVLNYFADELVRTVLCGIW